MGMLHMTNTQRFLAQKNASEEALSHPKLGMPGSIHVILSTGLLKALLALC